MKIIIALVALLTASSAFADDTKIEQVRGEVEEFMSMTDIAKISGIADYMPMLVSNCKALRNNDSACEKGGTEPVAVRLHLTLLKPQLSLIPAGLDVQVGDYAVTENTPGQAPKLIAKLDKSECRWAGRLLNLGGQQLECSNDDATGWEQGTAIMVRYPLKHQQEHVAAAE